MLWSVTLACVAVFFVYQCWRRHEHFQQFKKLGIPGPPPSFLFGNMVELYLKSPLHAHREWHRQYGPVLGYYFGYDPVLLVADIKDLKNILLRDFTDFTDRPQLMKGRTGAALTILTGQRWKNVRSTLTPSFTTSKLKQLSPEVERVVDGFMDNVHKEFASRGRSVDIYELYQALTLETICHTALGVDYDIQSDVANSKILQKVKVVFTLDFNLLSIFLMAFPTMRRLTARFIGRLRLMAKNKGEDPIDTLKKECANIVKRRRNDASLHQVDLLQLMIDAQAVKNGPGTDINSLIAGDEAERNQKAQQNKKKVTDEKIPDEQCPMTAKLRALTDEEVIDNALVVLLAGYETTSSSLAFITRLLVRFPEVQERLRQALVEATENGTGFDFERLQRCEYLDAVIQESLRMYPPVYSGTTRIAAKEKQYGDLTIPENIAVFTSTRELHNNPDIFPNPHEYQPDRFLPENRTADMAFAWQPFGAGPRNCIGMKFAQMEIKIALAKLLMCYRLTGGEKDPVGDAHVDTTILPALQRIKDPLLVTLTKLDERLSVAA
ncbi:thromboxane-A synthase-like [Tropilaelaps mercedesae]|uniref:Thromboxane-A synthase-like n=1 Tax=Tropilaelaps mercedesae TaxID=418985 RepID=A0A1V9XLX1_9ACAR|nr:thromboxane-A synthase-like [Tropilaelaps mercedesae]